MMWTARAANCGPINIGTAAAIVTSTSATASADTAWLCLKIRHFE